MKKAFGAYPAMDAVYVCVQYKHEGPITHSLGNPAVGWVVRGMDPPTEHRPFYGTKTVSPVFKNLKKAKRWAEDEYDIAGWMPMDPRSAWKHVYAIPRKR